MKETFEKQAATLLAKAMAVVCVRNSRLEDLHAGRAALTRTGDHTDVQVVDADGQQIPWTEVSRIDDAIMRRPCADREEKRVTHGRDERWRTEFSTEQLDPGDPNQRRLPRKAWSGNPQGAGRYSQ